MTSYGEWLDKLAAILGHYVPERSIVLQSYFRRGFTPAAAADLYQPITERLP